MQHVKQGGPAVRGAVELALVVVSLAGLTVLLTWPVAGSLLTAIPAGPADPVLNAWTLAWGSDRLTHGLVGFWTPPAFYPYRGTLAYSENLLGIAVLVAPVQWLGENLVLTYNIAFLLAFVVAGAGMYLLAREVTGRRDAAVVAAVFFAFCPYRAAQVTHLQVLMSGWLPIALYGLHRFLSFPRPAVLALCLGAFLLQAMSNMYSLVFSLIPLTTVVAWAAWTHQGTPRAFRLIGAGVAATALILLPGLVVYSRVWRSVTQTPGDVLRYSADLVSFLQVTPRLWYARLLPGPGLEEGNLFPGVTVIGLAGLAGLGWLQKKRGVCGVCPTAENASRTMLPAYLLAGLIGVVLSLGPEPRAFGQPVPMLGWLYRGLLAVVPAFAVFRVPARFGMVVVLALAVIAAAGTAWLCARVRRPAVAWGLALFLAGAVALEGYAGPMPMTGFRMFRNQDEQMAYGLLRHRPVAPMLELPVASLGPMDYSLSYQVAALFHRHPIVNGMSRVRTPLQDMLGGSASPFVETATIATGVEMLRAMGVEYLTIHPFLYRDRALAEQTIELLRNDQEQVAESLVLPEMAVFTLKRRPQSEAGEAALVPSGRIVARASLRPDLVARTLDGDPRTRWTSGRRQQGDEWLSLSLPEACDLAAVELVLSGRSLRNYPRMLAIEGVNERGEVTPLYRGSVLPQLGAGLRRDPDRPPVRLALPPNHTSILRLRQLGVAPTWSWAIDELRLWRRKSSGPPNSRNQAGSGLH